MSFVRELQRFLDNLSREGYQCPTAITLPRRIYDRVYADISHSIRYTPQRVVGIDNLTYSYAAGCIQILRDEPVIVPEPVQAYISDESYEIHEYTSHTREK